MDGLELHGSVNSRVSFTTISDIKPGASTWGLRQVSPPDCSVRYYRRVLPPGDLLRVLYVECLKHIPDSVREVWQI